jgi:hypothetical protein
MPGVGWLATADARNNLLKALPLKSVQFTLQVQHILSRKTHLRHKDTQVFLQFHCSNYRPKRCEVEGEWRKLHNEELNDLYSSPNII